MTWLESDQEKEYYHVCKDTFYALILHKEQLKMLLDMTNANTASKIQFVEY